jgi:hypothetical protein
LLCRSDCRAWLRFDAGNPIRSNLPQRFASLGQRFNSASPCGSPQFLLPYALQPTMSFAPRSIAVMPCFSLSDAPELRHFAGEMRLPDDKRFSGKRLKISGVSRIKQRLRCRCARVRSTGD